MNAQKLWEVVKNVSLFSSASSVPKSIRIRFKPGGDIEFATSDDVIGVVSTFRRKTMVAVDQHDIYIPHKNFRDLEKFLRDKGAGAAFSFLENPYRLVVEADGIETRWESELLVPEPMWWTEFDRVLSLQPDALNYEAFVDPSAFCLMNRLEPKGQWPWATAVGVLGGYTYLLWKYGPDTRGVITPLDPNQLTEIYDRKDISIDGSE